MISIRADSTASHWSFVFLIIQELLSWHCRSPVDRLLQECIFYQHSAAESKPARKAPQCISFNVRHNGPHARTVLFLFYILYLFYEACLFKCGWNSPNDLNLVCSHISHFSLAKVTHSWGIACLPNLIICISAIQGSQFSFTVESYPHKNVIQE